MKTIFMSFLAFVCASAVIGQSKERIKGSGPSVTRTLSVSSFSTVECSLSADVEITQGPTQKVTVEGQANIIDLISTEVVDRKWKIKLPKNTWADYENVTIKITVPELNGIGLAGSGSMTTTNTIKSEDFQIGLSGSGKIEASVDAAYIDCGLSGSGHVYLTGKAKELNIGTSGSGDVRAKDCPVEKVKIGISGSGDCEVNATTSLEAGIAGSGQVRYKGHPKVKSSISGSGSIHSID